MRMIVLMGMLLMKMCAMMSVLLMMYVLITSMGCMVSSITHIDMEKTDKREIHQKIFDEMDEMIDAFSN